MADRGLQIVFDRLIEAARECHQARGHQHQDHAETGRNRRGRQPAEAPVDAAGQPHPAGAHEECQNRQQRKEAECPVAVADIAQVAVDIGIAEKECKHEAQQKENGSDQRHNQIGEDVHAVLHGVAPIEQ